ncbi:nucleotide exchange factor GrpE [Paenibacillus sp. TRM 82003]|uniref:nucleotide exchange factor GrpE n=1 Tax=Kineococcus sp. TRM81007 TaxID=2925831 RepID=UPI001F580084|nr:nucleotide exchange factor GrpE [Kineococcus sp. TRM81007]MCI2237377.1 nucleotide exchange factor GrpE [Kineococcus sp. TRM81007]MCI3926516.1 nucleotide exchange factor GrpE [Paenibacillus sp. TRM 82003]
MSEEFPEPTVVRDRRRIDPETGQLREPAPAAEQPAEAADPAAAAPTAGGPDDGAADAELEAAQTLAAERLDELQRLNAEYANYRKRVDRDRDVARNAALSSVAEALLPVLDDVHLARQHGDLNGPFAAIAEKLETTLGRFGLERYGENGEPFDPSVHEALMHSHSDEHEVATCVQVLQPGYRFGERVLRPARVAVADPQG